MSDPERTKDFLRAIVDDDLASGRHTAVATRFPPEPNGYLHIGHAKAISVDFGIARDYGGTCNLRYDDTNPTKEEVEYVESIERDVRWLGCEPTRILYASDYFEHMYQLAEKLVRDGKAYVCELDDEQIKEYRGSLSEPGRPSPWRDRTPDDNLARLRAMRAGELPDGACVLRAKIDMAASNMKMRDPLLYRIRHAHHHRTGDAWCIYPMYDYAHPLSDALEGITHSICTLEFENNRELYDWVIAATGVAPLPALLGDRKPGAPPRQYEFARLFLEYTMMSKRKLLHLVKTGVVSGWDDPRMPTLAGLRRRGYTPEAIRGFCELVGVAKNNSMVDIGKLEFAVRDDLNRRAPRLLGVLRPLAVELTNVDGGSTLSAPLFPEDLDPDAARGRRELPFDKHLYIERDDFADEPPAGWKRLAPGRVVRLRHGGCIRCDEVVRDGDAVVGLRCSVVDAPDKAPGVIHWVSATRGVAIEVRLYDRLFLVPRPDAVEDLAAALNPRSLEVVRAIVEPYAATAAGHVQLERLGYFIADDDSQPGAVVWNRVITLRDAVARSAAVEVPAPKAKSSRAATRPDKKSGKEQRAIARERDAELAARHARALAAGLADDEADLVSGDRDTSDFYEATVALAPARARAVARWIVNELPRELGDDPIGGSALTAAALAALVGLVDDGAITGAVGKELLGELVRAGGDPVALVDARGLRQVAGAAAHDALAPIVADVLAKNPAKVAEYRGGRTGLLGFFVGQVMKASGGKANPATVNELTRAALDG